MKSIENQTFDEERALYGERCIELKGCTFDGPADGESALKESSDIRIENCLFNLRYPLWHDKEVYIENSEMTSSCRAAVWYSEDITVKNTKMHGIKAFRECSSIDISDCEIISPEFGWSVSKISMKNTMVQSEYFMMRSSDLDFLNVTLKGKYSFQYIEDSIFVECNFDTKDAFWHCKNTTVRDSIVKGEYLGWYSDGLTFINCIIIGTQPLCYCKNLRLINCEMHETDLCFEKSDVKAEITTHVESIKNPKSGVIIVPSVGEMVMEDDNAKGIVRIL